MSKARDLSHLNELTDLDGISDGTNGQVLTTNGSGTFTFSDAAGGDLVDDTTPQLGGNLDANGNDIAIDDDNKLEFGADADLEIYHDSTDGHSYIEHTKDFVGFGGYSALRLKGPSGLGGGNVQIVNGRTGYENEIILAAWHDEYDGAGFIRLYHGDHERLETQSTGVDITGNITVSGTVDGRDVATDGTKLDGIAVNATNVSALTDLSISDGTNGQVLTTDGSGTFTFEDSSGSVTSVDGNTGAVTTLQLGTTSTTALAGDTALFSGSYTDLTSKPTLLTLGTTSTTALAGDTSLFSGAYADLTGKPTIPTNNNQLTNGASYITDYTVTSGDVTAHEGNLTITESQISDLGSYITGYTVTESDVTAHQAALSITESQISDLGSYITGYTVTESDVTAHEAALSIATSQLTGNIDLTSQVTGTLPVSNMAATALTTVQTAASESAQLALTAQEGDVVVRSDENKTYMHNGGSAGTMADFTLLATPTDSVTSVNGNTGAVTVTVPTATSHLTNDSGFITSADGGNATTLDSIDSSSFLRSDVDDTMTGQLTISNSAPQMKFNDDTSGEDDFWIHVNNSNFYILTDRDDNGSWDGSYPLQLTNSNSTITSYGKTVWTSGNDGSGSTLDADKLDGYHANTTRNSANTIPIRDGNGYLQLGWINTTSGATTATLDRIYASSDGYIRYVTPATLGSQLGQHISYSDLTDKPTLLTLGTTSTTALAGNTSIPSALTDLSITDGTNGQVLTTNGSGSFTFGDAASGDVVDDTTPQLGGNLDLNSKNITGTGSIDITGKISTDTGLRVDAAFPSIVLEETDTTNLNTRIQSQSGSFGIVTINDSGNGLSESTRLSINHSTGVAFFNGNITLIGGATVDGREVSTDGTKLDTIDTNADVTPSWVPSSDPSYLTSYTVTESDVTAHQAALSITESQISDLGSYLTSVPAQSFASLTGKPTTISGYGITDALEIGTTSTTALAGNTSLFSGAYADLTGTPTIPGNPAITSNGSTPSLASGITAAEVRSLIGAGTSSSNNATHTGEVTGSGALTIAADVVDAGNLKVTGDGTTTQFLRSDGDGTFTWATPTDTNTTYSVGDNGLTEKNFTSALKTKLDGIEASADVTDATNVTAAGALMDSEVTNLAQVKAFNSADYATASQGTTANSAMQDLVNDTSPQLGGDLDLNSNSITSDVTIKRTDGQFKILNGAGSNEMQIITTRSTGTGNAALRVSGGSQQYALFNTSGVDITGNITVSGTVDGRDVATDGTKLDTIDTNADVTPSWVPASDPSYLTSADGGNADTVDSLHASSFLRSDAFDTSSSGLYLQGGSYNAGTDTATAPLIIDEGDHIYTKDGGYLRKLIGKTTGDTIEVGHSGTSLIGQINLLPGNAGDSAVKINGNTVWNAGNDGSGSGLDADTLDGIQASSFLRSDAADTMSADLTVSASILPQFMRITGTNDTGYAQFSFGSGSSPSTTGTHMINTASGLFQIKTGNPASGSATKQLEIDTSGNLTATGNITAYSDERLKSDVKTLDGSKVYQMRGVSFTKEGAAGSGVIAQELQKVAPELVQDGGEYLSVAYGNVVGYLIEAIKELKVELEDLKKG